MQRGQQQPQHPLPPSTARQGQLQWNLAGEEEPSYLRPHQNLAFDADCLEPWLTEAVAAVGALGALGASSSASQHQAEEAVGNYLWDEVFYESAGNDSGQQLQQQSLQHVFQEQRQQPQPQQLESQQHNFSGSDYSYCSSSSPTGSHYSKSPPQDDINVQQLSPSRPPPPPPPPPPPAPPAAITLSTHSPTTDFNIPDLSVLDGDPKESTGASDPSPQVERKPVRRRHRKPANAATSIRYGIPSGTVKCPVCVDGESGSHTYYGGKVCHSCRGFFRRSVQNNHHPFFSCKGAKRCKVESKTRKSCKWCRFHRCLSEAGLQVELVLSAQERRQLELKKTQNRLARRRKRAKGSRAMTTTFASSISSPRWSGQDDGNDDNGNGDNGNDNSDNPSSALVSLSGGDRRLLFPDFGEEERARFMLLYHRLHASNHVKRFQFLACDLGRVDSFLALGRRESPPAPKSFLSEMNVMDEMATKNFALGLGDMALLSNYDRMTLVQCNYELVNGFQLAWAYSNQDFPVYFGDFFDYGRRHRDSSRHVDLVMSLIADKRKRRCSDLASEVGTLLDDEGEEEYRETTKAKRNICWAYSNGVGQWEQEQLYADIMKWVRLTPDSSTDLVLNVLMTLVMLFDVGGVRARGIRLEDPVRVDGMRNKFLRILQRYLRCAYPQDGELRFQENMKSSSKCRRFYEIHKYRVDNS